MTLSLTSMSSSHWHVAIICHLAKLLPRNIAPAQVQPEGMGGAANDAVEQCLQNTGTKSMEALKAFLARVSIDDEDDGGSEDDESCEITMGRSHSRALSLEVSDLSELSDLSTISDENSIVDPPYG